MNNELQAVFDYLEREKKLDRETLIRLVEESLQVAGRKSIGPVRDLRVEVDRRTLDIKAYSSIEVVDFVRNRPLEISLEEANVKYPGKEHKIGDLIEVEVTPRNFGRIAAQTAKQAIIQKLHTAEKDKVASAYRDRVGQVVAGTVSRIERGDVYVDLGDAEGVLPNKERVPSENYQIGDRMRFLLTSLDRGTGGAQMVLSRANPQLVKRLFELEVSEIADGTVEIKGLAREPGFRTKLAVHSRDDKVDPVGACVGLRGQRVKNIVRELSGEKVDIVKWSPDIKVFVQNALAPAKLTRTDVDEAAGEVKVTVAGDQLSLAIGKRGQNARLTARLTGWKVDIQRDEDDMPFEERMAKEKAKMALALGETMAERLVELGFTTLQMVCETDAADLVASGLSEEEAAAVKEGASRGAMQ